MIRRIASLIGRLAKSVLSATLYRPGSVARILFGPARGLKYVVYPGYGLSHLYGGWEPEVLAVLVGRLLPGGVVYDLGANYGLHTLLMARLVGPAGRVFAFEPIDRIRAELARNVSLNGFSQVEVVPLAVSDRCGPASMFGGAHDGAGLIDSVDRGNKQVDHTGTISAVVLTTLDAFVAAGHPPPAFIKMDIEGAEGSAVLGAKRVLAEHRPVLLIELHSPEQDVAVAVALGRLGYTLSRVSPPVPPITNLTVGWPHQNGVWGQILALPPQGGPRNGALPQ